MKMMCMQRGSETEPLLVEEHRTEWRPQSNSQATALGEPCFLYTHTHFYTPPPPWTGTAAVLKTQSNQRFNAHPVLRQGTHDNKYT